MADNDTVINALLDCLDGCLSVDQWQALRALVAERDALRKRVEELEMARNAWQLEAQLESQNAKSFWRERAERRDAEQRREADRDLRERLVCAIWPEIMRQWREYKDAIDPRGDARSDALVEAEKMLAAMRKGESDAK